MVNETDGSIESSDYFPPEEGQFWTPRDLAAKMHFGTAYIQMLCQRGEIKATKWKNRWRIPEEEATRLLQQGLSPAETGKRGTVTEIAIPEDKLRIVAPELFQENEEQQPQKPPWWKVFFG